MENYLKYYDPIRRIFISTFFPIIAESKLKTKHVKTEEQLSKLNMGYVVYFVVDDFIAYLSISIMEKRADIGLAKYKRESGVMLSAAMSSRTFQEVLNTELEDNCDLEMSNIENLIKTNADALAEYLKQNALNDLKI